MKVLFLTNLPAPYRVDFFSVLGQYVDLTIIYERDSASDRNKEWKSNATKRYKEIFLNSKKIGTDNSVSLDIIKHLKKEKYDYIIIGQYSTYTAMLAILYMKLHKIPFIINSDGGFINKEENKIKCKLKRLLISSANYWLSTGKHTTEYLMYYGAISGKIFKYPFTSIRKNEIINSRNLQEEKDKYKKLLGLNNGKKLILMVGSFIDRKGIDILIQIAKKLNNNIEVLAIGGRLSDEYIELIRKLKVENIKFMDFMKKDKLLNYYKAADIFVFPTREDIWGLVINEALSMGVPVVTSKKCGAGLELIKDEYNGHLINNVENYDEYADIINKYCNDIKMLHTMSNNCIETIKEYTIEKMAIRTYEILQNIK